MDKRLIAYYSRTGTTEELARQLAGALDADMLRIECTRYIGFVGYIRAAYDSLRRRLPSIDFPKVSMEDYDILVVMTPVWTSYGATPMRAFLAGELSMPDRVALAVTYGGHSPAEKALDDLKALLPREPEAALALAADAIKGGEIVNIVANFADRLKRR